MTRRTLIATFIALLSVLTLAMIIAQAEAPQVQECGGNLLENADFEGSFLRHPDPYDPDGSPQGELQLALAWYPWYDNVQECPPEEPSCNPASYNRRPEWKRYDANVYPFPLRARSLPSAQMMFTWSGTHTAGFYQQAEVPAGSWVEFSIWVQVWSNLISDPYESTLPGDYEVRIGIDPTGGTDWRSEDIVWGNPVTHYDEYIQLQVAALAISDTVTVYTRGAPYWPVQHNDSYWDDACLTVLGGTPTPSPTATLTPSPTVTRTPTPHGTPAPDCVTWTTTWEDSFDDPDLPGWGVNLAGGSATVEDSQLKLGAQTGNSNRFPLLWRNDAFPNGDEITLRMRFRFADPTAYGTAIGVGSDTYDGQRHWYQNPIPSGIRNILDIYHSDTEFYVMLLRQDDRKWVGAGSDEEWHLVELDLRGRTYTLSVDGTEIGTAESMRRPVSMYLGNPIVMSHWGTWTGLDIDYVDVTACRSWYHSWEYLPLICKRFISSIVPPTPVPTVPTPRPTLPTATPTAPSMEG